MIVAKIHKAREKTMLSICDKNLLGKKFNEKGLEIDLTTDFYMGEEKTMEELRKIIKNIDMMNVTGKEAVDFAVKEKLIEENNIIIIEEVPHAQALFTSE
ncbi:DUF424 family protein [Candidatus Woesearchaeota archaeon]|nr:DUF424 family protein [Candidatus Woesearchaeota archaeon]